MSFKAVKINIRLKHSKVKLFMIDFAGKSRGKNRIFNIICINGIEGKEKSEDRF